MIAQKKNPIFRFLTFMVSLYKSVFEIWNKLPKTAIEVSSISKLDSTEQNLRQRQQLQKDFVK